MFRKVASIAVAAAATALLWAGSANAQIRTAALEPTTFKLAQAQTQNRIALVIGNSQYQANTPLNNPINDAQAVAQVLNTAGFEVVMAFDLAKDVMKQTVEEFAARANEKGPNTVVLVYYAGHGLQVDGENYLVPVDAKFQAEAELPDQGIKLAEVMTALESANSKMRIVILDACRNNPFGGLSSGLAIVDAPAGSIVAYSTAPGTEAFDGKGKHSPYAAAFLRTVKQPNLPIEQVFKKVRVLVNEATDTKQTPWESSSLTDDFVFFANNAVNNGAPVADVVPVRVSVAELSARPVEVAYEAVIAENSEEYFQEFIRLYPTDPRCDHIKKLLGRRQQMVAWQVATHTNSTDAYDNFRRRFGSTDLGFAARRLQERPRVINIAFPRKGEGRFGDGRFGTRIDFGRLTNNSNRPQAIDFRNAGGRQNGFPQNGANNGNRPFQNGINNSGLNNNGRPFNNAGLNNNPGVNNGGRPFPNGNTGINGSGRPNANNSGLNNNGGRPFPNGNTGINGSGQPNANNSGLNNNGGRPFPNGNTGINGSGQPNANNSGLNNNGGRPFPNGNTGINGSGQPNANNSGLNNNGGRPFPNGNTGINGSGRPNNQVVNVQNQQPQFQQRPQIQQIQQRPQIQQIQQRPQFQQQQIQRQPQVIQRTPQVQQFRQQSFQAPRQSFSSGGNGGGGRGRR